MRAKSTIYLGCEVGTPPYQVICLVTNETEHKVTSLGQIPVRKDKKVLLGREALVKLLNAALLHGRDQVRRELSVFEANYERNDEFVK